MQMSLRRDRAEKSTEGVIMDLALPRAQGVLDVPPHCLMREQRERLALEES